jgi:hypothetical protein
MHMAGESDRSGGAIKWGQLEWQLGGTKTDAGVGEDTDAASNENGFDLIVEAVWI